MGRHVLGSRRPVTLGVTQERQHGEMKAGEGSTQLGVQGAGLAGQLQPASGLVRGVQSGCQLAEPPLLASSVLSGDCGTWGLLVASLGLTGLVQTAGRSSSGTVTSPALPHLVQLWNKGLPGEKRRWAELFGGATSPEPAGVGGGTGSSLFG